MTYCRIVMAINNCVYLNISHTHQTEQFNVWWRSEWCLAKHEKFVDLIIIMMSFISISLWLSPDELKFLCVYSKSAYRWISASSTTDYSFSVLHHSLCSLKPWARENLIVLKREKLNAKNKLKRAKEFLRRMSIVSMLQKMRDHKIIMVFARVLINVVEAFGENREMVERKKSTKETWINFGFVCQFTLWLLFVLRQTSISRNWCLCDTDTMEKLLPISVCSIHLRTTENHSEFKT